MPVHSPGHDCLCSLARHGPRRPALANYNSHSSKVLTSRMAEQKRLCRTRCRACSFCGGSSPLRCSRSSSSTARDTSAERGRGKDPKAAGRATEVRLEAIDASRRSPGPQPQAGCCWCAPPQTLPRPQAAPRPPRLRLSPASDWRGPLSLEARLDPPSAYPAPVPAAPPVQPYRGQRKPPARATARRRCCARPRPPGAGKEAQPEAPPTRLPTV